MTAGNSHSGSQPLLTVITTAYNVASYVRRCMDSICRQDYRNLEVICIDDGSTDDTLTILREYEQKDARVRIVHQSNTGQARARNVALDMARGDWLTFIDMDDYLLPKAYSTLMASAVPGIDVVIFGIQIETSFDSLRDKARSYQSWVELKTEGVMKLDADYTPDGNAYLVNKIFRRSLFEKHHLRLDPQLCVCEDKCLYMRFCAYASTAFVHRRRFYVYDLRESSTMFGAKDHRRWTNSFLGVFDNIVSTFRQEGLVHEYLPWISRLLTRTQGDLYRWAFPIGTARENMERLLQLVEKHQLQEEAGLLPRIHEVGEQLRAARQAGEILQEACPPSTSHGSGGTGLHIAIPVDEPRAGVAVLLAQSIREKAGCDTFIHFVCDGVSQISRKRMQQLDEAGHCRIRLHECDSKLLHSLPPLGQQGFTGYLKMALPRLLPDVSRVLVLEPGLLVRGALPPVESFDMGGHPIAVSEDLPLAGKRETQVSLVEMQHYVSSDLILMDLDRMRESGGGDSWLDACMMRPHPLPEPEQNALNLAFQGRMAFLPDVSEWLSRPELHSVEVRSCHQRSPWADFPIDHRRARLWMAAEPPAPTATPSPAMFLLGRYNELRRRYYYYKIMAKLLWGKRRRHYKEKRNACRQLLREIREQGRQALRAHKLPW